MECVLQFVSDLIVVYGLATLIKIIEIGFNIFGG